MKIGAMLLVAVLCTGCATNGYKQFYQELPRAKDVLGNRVAPAPAEPKVERLGGQYSDYEQRFARAGYIVIGHSSFNGAEESDRNAIAQGRAVAADIVVILSPKFTETRTASIPITTPTTQTSYTNANATAYGGGQTVNAYGNSTTTTYGTQTNYIPVTTHRYDQTAVYLVKRKFSFGAYFDALTDSERAQLGSNKGVRIMGVVDSSPAFDADLLVDDIVLAINGRGVAGPEAMNDLIDEFKGQRIELSLLRGGQPKTLQVQLGSM
jgi:hypothetical protein